MKDEYISTEHILVAIRQRTQHPERSDLARGLGHQRTHPGSGRADPAKDNGSPNPNAESKYRVLENTAGT
ncbi:MAG UNVERIFIED_CONTAM: hypothetical protein LVQ98_03165 [Rickettsiaceae bacterium]